MRIGTPIILGQLGLILVNILDNVMVGKYQTDALAAASFVNNIFSVFFVLGMGFSYGLTPLISQAFARNQTSRLGRLLRHSVLLNTFVGAVLCIPLVLIYLNVERFQLPEHLLPQVRSYFLLQLASFMIYMATCAFKQFFDGIGSTIVPMWVIFGANALNIIGNYLLIFGVFGFPEWGLFGAGLSTLFSRIFSLIALAAVLHYSQALSSVYSYARELRWLRSFSIRLFRLGLPIGIQTGVEAGAWSIAILLITPLGVDALAVHQILISLTTLGFFIYYGLGAATTILVSRAYSHGDMLEARNVTRSALLLAEVTALVVMSTLLLGRHHLGHLFSDDSAVITMAALAIIPMALYQPGDALQVIYSNALRGLEDVKRMAYYACAVHLGLAPLLSYLFGFHLGLQDAGAQLTAIWSSFPISLMLLGLLLAWRFRSTTRRIEANA